METVPVMPRVMVRANAVPRGAPSLPPDATMKTVRRVTRGESSRLPHRDTLLAEHLRLVYFVARQLGRTMSADTDIDELINIGTLGLIEAVESFEPARGLAFSTYAVPRIRGAILDELRRQDVVPRSVRKKTRDMSAAREVLMRDLGRTPRHAELSAYLGVDDATLWRWQNDIERTTHVTLTPVPPESGDASASPLNYLPSTDEFADARMERLEEAALIRDALLALPAQQRMVLMLSYYEDLDSREIARVLGVSQSRVSQIRTKALGALREVMQPLQASA